MKLLSLVSIPPTTLALKALSPLASSLLLPPHVKALPTFISPSLASALRTDVTTLREGGYLKQSGIGDAGSKTTFIRKSESVFLTGSSAAALPTSGARAQLFEAIGTLITDLNDDAICPDNTELLYAYYPRGGFYGRHIDSVPC